MAAAFLKAPGEIMSPAWVSGCSGKIGYSGKNFATMVAKKHSLTFPPYRCKCCRKWHITSRGK